MEYWKEDYEIIDEVLEEDRENEWHREIEFDIPEVRWAEDIENIENLILKAKEIESADNILQMEREWEARYEAGEISLDYLIAERLFGSIGKAKRQAATRSGLASVGITYNDLGILSGDAERLYSGDIEMMGKDERLKEVIETMRPESAQELADEMLEEGEISEETYEYIKDKIRTYGK